VIDRAARKRYPTAGAFLEALRRVYAGTAYSTSPDGSVWAASCPVCRSLGRPPATGWARWPLIRGPGAGGRWWLFASCGCSELAIVAALIASERNRLGAELAGLGATDREPRRGAT
jgi:hypothetical protein